MAWTVASVPTAWAAVAPSSDWGAATCAVEIHAFRAASHVLGHERRRLADRQAHSQTGPHISVHSRAVKSPAKPEHNVACDARPPLPLS